MVCHLASVMKSLGSKVTPKTLLNTQKTCLLSFWGLPQIKRLPAADRGHVQTTWGRVVAQMTTILNKVSFINHVVKILGIFDPLPPSWSLLLNKAYVIKWSSG